MSKQFNVSVPTSYKTKAGEKKQKWTIIGKAFETESGSINVKLDNNITVSNEFVLFEDKKD